MASRPTSASVSSVTLTTDVASAEARARALLGAGSARWQHVAGVASAAAAAAEGMSDWEAGLLVAAAWLHDIGYAAEVADTGFHPLDGARYLRSSGAPDRLCCLVANHTNARTESEARGLVTALAEEFPAEDSLVADALTFADLTTGPTGSPVSVEARLREILERYEPGHVVHESIRQEAPDLIATIRRVEARLATAHPR